MSVDERLLGWERPAPELDADAVLADVHREVRRRRRRRVVAGCAAAVVLLGSAMLALAGTSIDAELDTVGPGRSAPVRYLPSAVPTGFELAWVDDREDPVAPPDGQEPWRLGTPSAYVYGYRSATVEIQVDVFPGYALDVAEVAEDWEADGDVRIISEEPGRGAVAREPNGFEHAAIEIDGAVVFASSHGLGDEDATWDFGLIEELVRSFRVVDEDTWGAAVVSADVARTYGERGEGDPLVTGDDWQLVRVPFRNPRALTEDSLVLRVAGASSENRYFAHQAPLHDAVWFELFDAGGRTIAWGIAPPETAVVRLWSLAGTVEVGTVPFAENVAFAVELSASSLPLRELTALDPAGRRLHAFTNPDRVVECAVDGEPGVSVPDVVGTDLSAAVAAVEDAGLQVQGTGVPPGDPVDRATVTSQEPPPGSAVPPGACVGFRTR